MPSKAPLPDWFIREEIDTVIVAFADVYGRLMGKRLTTGFFIDEALHAGAHVCNYLLTVDIEMNPLEGFELANWDKGYGDFHLAIDIGTLRRIPWLPRTALVLGDLEHEDGSPVLEAPRSVLRRQLDRLAAQDLSAYMASELEFYLYRDSYADATAKGHRELQPSSDYLIDYHLLATSRDEDILGRVRTEMDAAGVIVEGSKGEWGKGQHEINLLYAEAMEMADRHVLFKHGIKEIAGQLGASVCFMAKVSTEDAGSSCHLHTSLWNAAGETNSFSNHSETFRYFLGGLMRYGRELCYFFAPTVNAFKRYQPSSWAPTSLAWAHDNRTTGYRVVGSGPALRIENRTPGADVNPYLAYAATIAAGLKGIEDKIDCGEPYAGNAYEDPELTRLPSTLAEAVDLLAGSALAREAFGDETVDFYVRTAQLEVEAYEREVTGWERRRYFERI